MVVDFMSKSTVIRILKQLLTGHWGMVSCHDRCTRAWENTDMSASSEPISRRAYAIPDNKRRMLSKARSTLHLFALAW
jgi:hypothetical protein